MGDFPMAIGARPIRRVPHRGTGIGHEITVATQAVCLDHLLGLLNHLDDLPFLTCCVQVGVPQPILGLKPIFVDRGIMGNVAIVAGGHSRVTRVLPTRVFGSHDVTVDASPGVVRHIAGGIRDRGEVQAPAHATSEEAVSDRSVWLSNVLEEYCVHQPHALEVAAWIQTEI